MGGGLVQLAGYGLQDMYLTHNPTITYFKMVYKRHTNFSSESIPQNFQNTPNFGGRYTCNIAKNGDLIGEIYLCITLPNLPKIVDTSFINQDQNLKNIVITAWMEKIGFGLIKSIEFEVGGKIIDKLYGDWLNIWYELSQKNNKPALNQLIGNLPSLTDYMNGRGSQLLHIPIPFYFCKYKGLALPLIALEYSDVKINVEFNNLTDVLIIGPTNYITVNEDMVNFETHEMLSQTINNVTTYGKFITYDELTNRLYYIKLVSTSSFVSGTAIVGTKSTYTVMPNGTEYNYLNKINNVFSTDSITLGSTFLYVDYIFLDNNERLKFARSNHEYLIEQLQFDNNKSLINNNNKIKILYNHPTKSLFFVTQFDYILNSNLIDMFNYTNSYDKKIGTNIVTNVQFLLNGKDRITPRESQYYSWIQNFQNFKNAASEGINAYSFSINSQEFQPSGSCNFSRIDDITLVLTVDKSISYQNTATARIYALSYNVLRIINGVAGLAFDS
jgi:hypothetical protein